ncbi:uncharacterized protein LOC142061676 [Phalacrocorax aristotelis]|uniref:uncharacterized protein LOC142061676 n=1 Tax=Phalacrocorax aristotelis TaxID=126867 RepID=UPI003F4C6DE5
MTVAVSSFPLPETVLRTWLSVLPPGMPLTAAGSGLCGFSLPGFAILAALGRKGTHGALPGCGQELPRLKLETPTKGEGGRIPLHSPQRARPPTCTAGWRTASSLELQKRQGGEEGKEASERLNRASSAESESCKTVLRTWLPVLPPGMPLPAAVSGLRGFSLPGFAILAAPGRKGTHGALPGCGQGLPRLKLETPTKGGGGRIPLHSPQRARPPTCTAGWRTASSLELQKRQGGEEGKEASERLNCAISAESESRETVLRTWLPVLPPGMPLPAAVSGLRGFSLPGFAILAAPGRKGTHGALPGCGQGLPRLKLETPTKGGGGRIPLHSPQRARPPTCTAGWRTASSLELQKRQGGEEGKEASERLNCAISAESESRETVLRTWLPVLPPGMPLPAAVSGLRGFSLPGFAILAAPGRKGTHGALPGCGQGLPRLKLETPTKGGGGRIPLHSPQRARPPTCTAGWRTASSLELQKRQGGEEGKEASERLNCAISAESESRETVLRTWLPVLPPGMPLPAAVSGLRGFSLPGFAILAAPGRKGTHGALPGCGQGLPRLKLETPTKGGGGRIPLHSPQRARPPTCTAGWRTASSLELQKRQGGEEGKEASERLNCAISAESESRETVLRTWLPVLPPGMPLPAAVSGLRGFSLPGFAILAAPGRKGTHGALPGCGQGLPRLKLETPTKGGGGRIPLHSPQRARPPTCTAGWRTASSLELQKRQGGEEGKEASERLNCAISAESESRETVLRTWLPVLPPGMPLPAAVSGLRGFSLPGFAILAAPGRKGTHGALPGCGQGLPRLKLETPTKGGGGRIPLHSPQRARPPTCTAGWRTASSLELQKRQGGEEGKEASERLNCAISAESESRETVLRTWLPVLPPGMPLPAAVSGLRGFSLPGFAILAAPGRKGTHGALPGCGQGLPRLKLETPTKGGGGRIPLHSPQRARPPTCTAGWRTASSLELQKRQGGEEGKEASERLNCASSAESESRDVF